MISVQAASQLIQRQALTPSIEELDILCSVGRVLATSVVADRDFPPFNRVAMDGIAVDVDRLKTVGQEFRIESVQAAGHHQLELKNLSSCIEVMTGAVLPQNTNAVIRYEDLEIKNGMARVLVDGVERGLNIHTQAHDARKGELLLTAGQKISSAEVALFASVGVSKVSVFSFPKTGVISIGDELVEVTGIPEAHQIRRSNTYALQAAMKEIHWESEAFHISDQREHILASLKKILSEKDVLILSGGVSKGKFDFIPGVLEELGIERVFHQISQRPGKPFWFGVSGDKRKTVFALPGNPVSTFLCFYKYIKPWISANQGIKTKPASAILATDVNFDPPLTYFLQVRMEIESGKIMAYPNKGGGSGDFANLKLIDGFLELPLGKSTFKAGESYPFISFRV